jgi:Fe-S cluster assembly protein SufD
MEARGIPADKARRLIVNGFFNSLLERLENGPLRQHLENLLAARLAIA